MLNSTGLPCASTTNSSRTVAPLYWEPTAGETTVIEPEATRDHTERMLRHFGAEVRVSAAEGGGKRITVVGWPELKARDIVVPGDPVYHNLNNLFSVQTVVKNGIVYKSQGKPRVKMPE